MKKTIILPLVLILSLFAMYNFLDNKCVEFGYDNISISETNLFCVKTITSDFGYSSMVFAPLDELTVSSKKYTPPPIPTKTFDTKDT